MSRHKEFENQNLQPQVDLPRGVRAHTAYYSVEKPYLVYGVGETKKEARKNAEANLGHGLNPIRMFFDGFGVRELVEGESYDIWADGIGFLNHGQDDGLSHTH